MEVSPHSANKEITFPLEGGFHLQFSLHSNIATVTTVDITFSNLLRWGYLHYPNKPHTLYSLSYLMVLVRSISCDYVPSMLTHLIQSVQGAGKKFLDYLSLFRSLVIMLQTAGS
jgi:hypothetical protein